jgi:heme-degrading monooxygenase HmoA
MITRIVQLTFQEHLVDDFLKTFEENGPKIRAMKGCHGVDLVQDLYRPYVFFTLSKWESEDDLNAYRESDLFRNTWKVTKSLFSVPAHAWSTTDTGK